MADLPVTTFWAREIVGRRDWIPKVIDALGPDVYVTIDMDVFDPGEVPAVGTPEPGGLGWYDALALLKEVARHRNIVACDLNEHCPLPNEHASTFFMAKLLYKVIGYRFFTERIPE